MTRFSTYLQRTLTMLVLLVAMGGVSAWADDVTGTITFGTEKVKISSASVTGTDTQGNTWTITTVGTTSFTSNSAYYQVGSKSKPATSITFTTTLSSDVSVTSFSAKFGGFNGTAGTVTLKVDDTTVGTGSLSGKSDVTTTNSSTATGKVLTVTVTGISKGVKCYNISYTYTTGKTTTSLAFATGNKIFQQGQNVDVFTNAATLTPAVEGATITYTSSDKNVAVVDDNTGEVTVDTKNAGTATITASYAGNDSYTASSASYTITVLPVYAVAQALLKDDGTEVIVKGVVASVSTWNSGNTYVNYWISDDGSTTSEMEIFKGKGLNGADITSQDDIARGDIVMVKGTLTTYNGTKELGAGSTLLSITKPDETAKVTDAGWATYVTKNAVSFPGTVKAFTVTYNSTDDKITLNSVASVPANTAVVLKGDAGTYTLTKVKSADAPASNDLKYSWSDKTIASGDNIYVLAKNNNGVIGFWPVTVGSKVVAFKGYLDLGSNSSAKSFFSLDDAVTGVSSIKAETKEDGVRYNLAGQRVDNNYKGVVIMNGKKFMVK